MAPIYDARGNRYAVVTPEQVTQAGIDMPLAAAQAASCSPIWALAAVARFCNANHECAPTFKSHTTDGLLIGPFQRAAPFDLLIVNTDGSLAERSGNGLTIFAQSLMDASLVRQGDAFSVNVHHQGRDIGSPVSTRLSSANRNDVAGFWLDLGAPAFGPHAVGATGRISESDSTDVYRVAALEAVRPGWARSVFVRLGNPHCVSLVERVGDLPEMEWLRSDGLGALTAIAFSSARGNVGLGDPCANGINLQWAAAANERRVLARVFERGEGPTLSSGTSACAVACALWKNGDMGAGEIEVVMPGGTAPVQLVENDGNLQQVRLFGVAQRLSDDSDTHRR